LSLFLKNENIRAENIAINHFQLERARLIEYLLYHNGVDDLLISWSEKIRQMALDSVPTKKGTQWMATWTINIESRLNNYKCAGDWFNNFKSLVPTNINIKVQRLVAYMLLEKTIRITFKQSHDRQHQGQLIEDQTESWIIPRKITTLEPIEASKFLYIIGWVIYKLTKSDPLTMAHKDFMKMRSCLNALSTENMEYKYNTRSKKTTITPGADFVQFMYYLESLVIQLFEKHTEYGPDILIYINNNLTNNQPLKEQFHTLLQKSYEHQYDTNHLSEEDERYLFMQLIKTYM